MFGDVPLISAHDVVAEGARMSAYMLQRWQDVMNLSRLVTSTALSVVQFGAKGDGVADDAPALQAAIDAAFARGGGIVFLPPGTYLCKLGLVLKTGVTLLGAGATVSTIKTSSAMVATAGNYYLITATGQSHIGLLDLGLDGNKTALVAAGYPTTIADRIYDLLHVVTCSRVTLSRVRAANCLGGATISITSGSDNVWITESLVADAGTNGLGVTCDAIYMNASSHVRVLHNQITDWNDTGLVWEHQMVDCVADGNRITSTVGGQDAVFIGGTLAATDLWVVNNTLTGRRGVRHTRLSGSQKRCTIAGNHIYDCPDTFIDVAPTGGAIAQDLVIRDNLLDGANAVGTNFNGIALDGTAGTITNAIVAGNRIRNIQKSGVRLLGDLAQVAVRENTLVDCGVGGATVDQQSGIAVLAVGTQTDLQIDENTVVCNGATMPYGVYYDNAAVLVRATCRRNQVVGATVALIGDPGAHAVTALYREGNGWPASRQQGVTGAIPTGTAVTHNLPATPTVVIVTAQDVGPTDLYVTAKGAAQFTINFGGGGNHVFAWEARSE